jgi:hypothetical protein
VLIETLLTKLMLALIESLNLGCLILAKTDRTFLFLLCDDDIINLIGLLFFLGIEYPPPSFRVLFG